MSKRDILTVCELAAHLALRDARTTPGHSPTPCHIGAPMYASDAMTLQRLGRSARNAERRRWAKQGNGPLYADRALGYVMEKAAELLAPYGLHPRIQGDYLTGPILRIIGLPGNTGDTDGFGV